MTTLHQKLSHPEYVEGCFGCKIGGLQLSTGDANGRRTMSQKKWDKELDAYRDARKQGIQPAGTSMAKIQQALDVSDRIGRPFDAGAKVI